jgi:type IV secretory pathway VirB2 component (pilin)
MKKFSLLIIPLFFARTASAACASPDQYELLVPIGSLSGCVDLGTYVKGMFETIIGIAGILAVVMIVICGIKLMTAGSAGGKSEAKDCITNALFGVLLAVGSWLILNTINPQLLAAKPSAIGVPVAPLAPSTPTPATPSGTTIWQPGPSCPAVAGSIVTKAPDVYCSGVAPTATSICCQYVTVPMTPPVGTPPIPVPPVGTPYVPVPMSGPVWIDSATTNVSEGAGSVTIIIRRGGDILGTVDYSITNDTATAGADFGSISGTLTFPPGVNLLSITIPILEDALVEGNERFILNITNATAGLFLGAPRALPITIVDNDVATPDVTPPVVSILYPVNAVGLVTTSPSISARVSVSEETKLYRVDVYSVRASTSVKISNTIACLTTPVCPTLGGTFNIASTTLGPMYNEYYNLVARGCDVAGNCGYATTSVGFTALCNDTTGATTSYRCFTLPTGAGATTSPTVPGRTNAHLIKLNSPTGGGTVSISTIAPYFDYYGESCTDMWGNSLWCGYGCAAPSYDTCNLVPTTPICGGIPCVYGCAVDHWTASCNLTPPPPMCGGISCPSGCAISPDFPMCFIPEPVVIASLATRPNDLSLGAPCGNGGSFPGATTLNITFGTSSPACVLKPYFNYFLDITASDGKPHNFQINYNWAP